MSYELFTLLQHFISENHCYCYLHQSHDAKMKGMRTMSVTMLICMFFVSSFIAESDNQTNIFTSFVDQDMFACFCGFGPGHKSTHIVMRFFREEIKEAFGFELGDIFEEIHQETSKFT